MYGLIITTIILDIIVPIKIPGSPTILIAITLTTRLVTACTKATHLSSLNLPAAILKLYGINVIPAK